MLKWTHIDLYTRQDVQKAIELYVEHHPEYGAFDTETNGLHIIHSKPFMFQFGWALPERGEGYTFTIDLEALPKLGVLTIKTWFELARQLKLHVGHNIAFDMHMTANVDAPLTHTKNISDTMFYIRHAHNALTTGNGGPPLKLKEYATRYITPRAKELDSQVKRERTILAQQLNRKLQERFMSLGVPPAKYNAKSYTTAVLKKMFKDCIFEWQDLETPEQQQAYLDWLQVDVPIEIRHKVTGLVESDHIPYNWVNRKVLKRYAHLDIVYTLETLLQTMPVIAARGTQKAIDIESALIPEVYAMERVGFRVDKAYLEESRQRVKAYILQRRAELQELTKQSFTISQHAVIKQIINSLGHSVTSTNAEEMRQLISKYKHVESEQQFCTILEIIQELRTLEKWYSAYILRFQQDLRNTDHIYTQINQVGTVTGRVTSDFQQFPRKAIKDAAGDELFHPRRMVLVEGDEYPAIVYIDYSQIELRFQAIYTILVGHADLNLCRAYMPYKCVNSEGKLFDYNDPADIKAWHEPWFYEENPTKRWEPTDVHGVTTTLATGLHPEDEGFKEARSNIAKRVNFAKNYGAQYAKIASMFPDKTPEEIRRIDGAYYSAFPGVKAYHDYCYARAAETSYTQNLFGVLYYGLSGHKLINTLIQGSAAYYMKLKEIELAKHFREKGYKSRWVMQIHDELSWLWHKDDPSELFAEVKQIMEDWPDALVPIVADIDITFTTWADKKGVESLADLQNRLST